VGAKHEYFFFLRIKNCENKPTLKVSWLFLVSGRNYGR